MVEKEQDLISAVIKLVSGVADGLYKYSKIHPMIAFGIMQLICNLNHVMLIPGEKFSKSGGVSLFAPLNIAGLKTAFTTKQEALAEAFMISGAKFGDLLSAEALAGITPLVTGLAGELTDLVGADQLKKFRLELGRQADQINKPGETVIPPTAGQP